MNKYLEPFVSAVHPVDTFDELKHSKKTPVTVSLILLLVWFLVAIFERQFTGFRFNPNRVETLNIFIIMAKTWGIYILWAVSNWAICTLIDGEGSFSEIWVYTSYALIPYLISTITVTLLSRIFVLDEAAFLGWIGQVGLWWSLLILFQAIRVMHNYSVGKTVAAIGLTIGGIFIIIFIAILIFVLFQQVVIFANSIISELMFRIG